MGGDTMKSIVYQEVVKNATYTLFGRDVGNVTIYDIEVETAFSNGHAVETVTSVSSDCQTSMLLLELLIQRKVQPSDLLGYSTAMLPYLQV
jgi:hypothetical protein